jgi:hypothetical protein
MGRRRTNKSNDGPSVGRGGKKDRSPCVSQGGQQRILKNHAITNGAKTAREVVCRRQYPITIEGKRGLQPVIKGLIKDGLLEPCMSPNNTPVLPVKKPYGAGRWWLTSVTLAT